MSNKHQEGRSKCRGPNCGAEIIWEETGKGKLMPLNPDRTPHWATCVDREHFKKKKETKK